MVLLCLRAGQLVPQHSTLGIVTVQCINGRATFYDGAEPCEMFSGMLVRLEAGRPHRVEAHEDTALLVIVTKFPQAAVLHNPAHAGAERELDLRPLSRPERHPLVFTVFDNLALNESFVLINDHDPQPLRMQIERMREDEMGWEYIERGPETFRIRVTRVASPTTRIGAVSGGTVDQPVTIG
jgi:uncharacterized protein (DUF2249 family)